MRNRLMMFAAALGALLGWAALALQLKLTLALMSAQGATLAEGLWRFFGYFTILSNLMAAMVLTLALLRRSSARLEFCVTTAMLLVGVVYSLLLRATWNPQGQHKIADMALHDILPVLMLLFWLLRPHGLLRARDIAFALILPLGYCAYAVARGAFDGWYAYPFIDLAHLGAGQVALNCMVIGAAFAVMATALRWLDSRLS